MRIENKIPEFPLKFKGTKGILATDNGNIQINDFTVNIGDDISITCKCDSIPEEYKHDLSRDDHERLKDIIPEDELSKMKFLDKYIPKEDILNLSLIGENDWEIELSNVYCGIGSEIEGYSLDIQAINLKAKNGKIESLETVQLYKILECYGDKKKIDSEYVFKPDDLQNLKFICLPLEDLEYSIGYFLLEDTYENIKSREEELTDNLYNLLSFFVANFVSLRLSILIGPKGTEINGSTINTMSSGKGSSIFYHERANELSNYLNSTYDNYVLYKESLGLKAVFRHYIRMKDSNHTEPILLYGSILFECLKYHYAKYKNYIEVNNRFIKTSANHKVELKSSGKYKPIERLYPIDKYSFKELVEEIYDEFKVVNRDTNFIKYRNGVVHQGIFDVPFIESKIILKDLEKSITETIFNILQFKGLYSELDSYNWVNYTPPA